MHVPPLRERREEIPQLIEFFLLKFATVYRRPAVRPSLVLQEALLVYEWPGNIRELENMMKRLVVLQDEALILAELNRLRQAAQAAGQTSAPPPGAATPLPAPIAPPPVVAAAPPPAPPPPAPPPVPAPPPEPVSTAAAPAAAPATGAVAVLDEPLPGSENGSAPEGVDLQMLAKNAALRAEREAIDRALVRFRWNRRKAAQYLNVSYKTLLNKIKECGISESGTE